MPINRIEILSLASVGLLFQGLELRSDGKLIRENQKLVASIAEMLSRTSKPASTTLMKMSCILPNQESAPPSRGRTSSTSSMSPPKIPEAKSSPREQFSALTARFSFSGVRNQKKGGQANRRATAPNPPMAYNLPIYPRSGSQASRGSAKSAGSEPVPSTGQNKSDPAPSCPSANLPNLDFFSVGSQSQTPDFVRSLKQQSRTSCEWDQLINNYASFDTQTPTGHYSAGNDFLGQENFTQVSPSEPTGLDWSPDSWNVLEASVSSTEPPSATAHSVFSLSDESLTSAEDLSICDPGSDYPGFIIPTSDEYADFTELGVHGDFHNNGLIA